ncbi:MAG: OmpA family protein [Hyphomicrobiaceae bacterium]|nr:OmpA family protein [Hyphomicrobiaceae bacterium]
MRKLRTARGRALTVALTVALPAALSGAAEAADAQGRIELAQTFRPPPSNATEDEAPNDRKRRRDGGGQQPGQGAAQQGQQTQPQEPRGHRGRNAPPAAVQDKATPPPAARIPQPLNTQREAPPPNNPATENREGRGHNARRNFGPNDDGPGGRNFGDVRKRDRDELPPNTIKRDDGPGGRNIGDVRKRDRDDLPPNTTKRDDGPGGRNIGDVRKRDRDDLPPSTFKRDAGTGPSGAAPALGEPPRAPGADSARTRDIRITPGVPPRERAGGDGGRPRDAADFHSRNVRVNEEVRNFRRERRREVFNEGPRNIDALRAKRREIRGDGGRLTIEEPDRRTIIRGGAGKPVIVRDETRRFRRFDRDAKIVQRSGGRNVISLRRPNGSVIFNETGPDGRLIRRYRRGPDGREIVLIDNRRTWRRWQRNVAIGAAVGVGLGLAVAIAPPIYREPREHYILDYDDASYDDIYDTLTAPPIDDIRGRYTLDEIVTTYNLRERMRRIDLDSITFETGSWEIGEEQFDKLERIASVIKRIVEENQDEVVLVEGHTDAVGDENDNLTLSDRRAEEVANILSEEFNIPPENLTTQGYGEEFLKVDTDGPSRANRRVTVRRITPLLDRSARYDDRD